MNILYSRWLLVGVGALLLAGCGRGGGAGDVSADLPPNAPIVHDLAAMLDLDTGGLDSVRKPPPPPTPVRAPDDVSGRNLPDGLETGGRDSGIDRKRTDDTPPRGGLDYRGVLGRPDGPVFIPTPIGPPVTPVPPAVSSGKDRFDHWILLNPPPDGGLPPREPGGDVVLDSDDRPLANSPGAITWGGEDRTKGGEEPVPEPATILLFVVGLAALWFCRKR